MVAPYTHFWTVVGAFVKQAHDSILIHNMHRMQTLNARVSLFVQSGGLDVVYDQLIDRWRSSGPFIVVSLCVGGRRVGIFQDDVVEH